MRGKMSDAGREREVAARRAIMVQQ